jgi:hypothetical protein
MSVEQLEKALLAMPPADREAFASWFDDHRHELIREEADLSPAVRDELALRLKETDERPEMLEPFEEADVERMFKEFADARAKKTSTRKG